MGLQSTFRALVPAILLMGLLGGCVLAPKGTEQERARLERAGQTLETPREQRSVPDLPAEAQWQDVLQRAFLVNGDLEATYFEWKAAMAGIDIAAAYPNSNVS